MRDPERSVVEVKQKKKKEISSVNDERVVCRSAAGVDGGGIDANI